MENPAEVFVVLHLPWDLSGKIKAATTITNSYLFYFAFSGGTVGTGILMDSKPELREQVLFFSFFVVVVSYFPPFIN